MMTTSQEQALNRHWQRDRFQRYVIPFGHKGERPKLHRYRTGHILTRTDSYSSIATPSGVLLHLKRWFLSSKKITCSESFHDVECILGSCLLRVWILCKLPLFLKRGVMYDHTFSEAFQHQGSFSFKKSPKSHLLIFWICLTSMLWTSIKDIFSEMACFFLFRWFTMVRIRKNHPTNKSKIDGLGLELETLYRGCGFSN